MNKYESKNRHTTHIYIDGQIVTNKFGVTNKERCTYYKSKNSYNLQAFADDNGVPLIFSLHKGSAYEERLLIDLFKKSNINDGHKYEKSKRYKQYFIANSGHDQKYNTKFLKDKDYEPLIWYNKRKFNKHQNTHYKRRHIIETLFSWLECKIPRLIKMFDKKIENYLNLAYLASADILFSQLERLN